MAATPAFKTPTDNGPAAQEPQYPLDKIETLYGQGKYLQALSYGENLYGPFRHWQGALLQNWSARIVNNLGMRRTAQALFIRNWRNHPQCAISRYYYARTLAIRKGTLAALFFMESDFSFAIEDNIINAKWLAYRAHLFAQYRDFENAEIFLDQAQSIAPNNTRVILERAYVLELQDQYKASFEQIEPLISNKAYQRDAVQQAAYLMILRGKTAKAIHLLMSALNQFESVGVAFQLLDILMECQLYQKVPAVLGYVEKNRYESSQEISQHLAAIKSNLAYFNHQLPACIDFAKQAGTSFHQAIAKNLSLSIKVQDLNSPRARVLLDVPFVRQHHQTCAPATLTALCKYWQVIASQEEIQKAICYNGTPGHAERKWAMENGFFVKEFELQPQAIITLINLAIPCTLTTTEPGNAHLQAIAGYDQARGVYLIRDSISPKIQEFLTQTTGARYQSTGPRCMALIPEQQAQRLKEITLPFSELYDQYYQLMTDLENHKLDSATQQLKNMLFLNPNHRLSLTAQRHVSHYQNDQAGTYEHTQKLLKRYPNDVNLALSKISLMRTLTSPRERLNYLEERCSNNACSAHLTIRLADELKSDHRQKLRTEKLFKGILKELPTDSKALYSFAGFKWNQREFKQGLLLFRLSSCLNIREEYYAERYFKAALHHHQKKLALSFLKRRYEQHLEQSTNPAASYCNALESIGNHTELSTVIDQVIQKHPHDGRFLIFAANIYLQNGEIQRAQTLLKQAETCSHRHDFLPILAALYERLDLRDKSTQAFEEILSCDPLNTHALQSIVRYKVEQNLESQAFEFIDSKLATYPSNQFLLRLKIDWTSDHQLPAKESALRQCLHHYPNDIETLCQLGEVLTRQQKPIDALAYFIKAQGIDPLNVIVSSMMGKYYLATQDLNSAQRYFRQAIHYAIDQAQCFDSLLKTSNDIQEIKQQLEFIHQELMSQPTQGETLLDFYNLLRMYLSNEEIAPYLKQLFIEKENSFQIWIACIRFQINKNDLDYALGLAQQASDYFPLTPRIWVEKAEIFRLRNQFEQAEQALHKSLIISPHWSQATDRLAALYEIQGQLPKAITLLKQSVKTHPFNPALHSSLAKLLWKENNYQQAISLMRNTVIKAPSYIEGWEILQQWSHHLGHPEWVRSTAQQLVNDSPHNPEHWTLLAYVTEDHIGKMEALEHALTRAPLSIPVNSAIIRCLTNQNRFIDAHQLCQHEKWDNKPPIEIKAYQAWIYAKENNIPRAIIEMKKVLNEDPSFFDGWQLLSQWSEQVTLTKEALECANQCLDLKPHCPTTLCFCAEKTISHAATLSQNKHSIRYSQVDPDHDSDRHNDQQDNSPQALKNTALALLNKAFNLDPSDQYNALTYIDFLIDQDDYRQATLITDRFKLYSQSPYLRIRQLNIACARDQIQEALDFWYAILNSDEASPWLFNTAHQLIEQTQISDEGFIELEKVLQQNDVNPLLGQVWINHYINQNKTEQALKRIKPLHRHEQLLVNATETLLKHLLTHQLATPRQLIKQCLPPDALYLHRDPLPDGGQQPNWRLTLGLITLNYVEHKQWKKAQNWIKSFWQWSDTEAWVIYYYGLAVRQLGHWDQAADINNCAQQRLANTSTTPSPHHGLGKRCLKNSSIQIWWLYDALLNKQQYPQIDHLLVIDIESLAPLEQYIYWIIYTLIFSQQQNVEDGLEIHQGLSKAKTLYPSLRTNPAAKSARKKTRETLARTHHGLAPLSLKQRIHLFTLF